MTFSQWYLEMLYPLKLVRSLPSWLGSVLIFVVAYAGFLCWLAPTRGFHKPDVPAQTGHIVLSAFATTPLQHEVAAESMAHSVAAPPVVMAASSAATNNSEASDNGVPSAAQESDQEKARVAALVTNTRSPDVLVRRSAVVNLASVSPDQALPALGTLVTDRNKGVRLSAIFSLRRLATADIDKADEVIATLSPLLSDADPAVVSAAQTAYQDVMEMKSDHSRSP